MKKQIITIGLILILLLSGCGKNKGNNELVELKQSTYSYVEEGIEALQDTLKNPTSLEVKGVIVRICNVNKLEEEDPLIIITYSYTAKNDFGNDVSNCVDYFQDTILPESEYNNPEKSYIFYQRVLKGKEDQEIYSKQEESIYSFENDEGDTVYVFEIDFSDYSQQDYEYLEE